MALTMAIMQLPMEANMPSICREEACQWMRNRSEEPGQGLTQVTMPILSVVLRLL